MLILILQSNAGLPYMQMTQEIFDRQFMTAQEIARELLTTVEQVHNLTRMGKLPPASLSLGVRNTRVWDRKVMNKAIADYKAYRKIETRGRKGKYA